MADGIRRVVTGHDRNGKAVVISDGPASNILKRPSRPGVTMTNLWQTDRTPADFNGPLETVDGPSCWRRRRAAPPHISVVPRYSWQFIRADSA